MLEIIKKIQELLQGALNEMKAKGQEADKKTAAAEEHERCVIEKESDLNEREKEIKSVENVVALAAHAEKTLTDAKLEFAKAEKLNAINKDEKADIAKQRADVADQRAHIKRQKESNMETYKALEKEKAEYKARIIEELKSKV